MTKAPMPGRAHLSTDTHRVTETTSEQVDYETWEHPEVDPQLRQLAWRLYAIALLVCLIGVVASLGNW